MLDNTNQSNWNFIDVTSEYNLLDENISYSGVIADFNNVNLQDSTVNIELIEYPDFVQDIELDTTLFKVRYR